jgi:hypothetical protein
MKSSKALILTSKHRRQDMDTIYRQFYVITKIGTITDSGLDAFMLMCMDGMGEDFEVPRHWDTKEEAQLFIDTSTFPGEKVIVSKEIRIEHTGPVQLDWEDKQRLLF